MTLAPPPHGLPPAYDGCTCSCHRVPGIMHFAPCCRPSKLNMPTDPEWYRKRAELEGDSVISAGVPDKPVANMVLDTGWVLVKRGAYWRPAGQGYTYLKSEAGRYSDEEAAAYSEHDGAQGTTGKIPWRQAPELSSGCTDEAARNYYQSRAEALKTEAAEAVADRDALLAALGWKLGPLKGRDIILQDAEALRPEMVRARNSERELKSDRDWDRMAAAELLRKWVKRKFGPWITWRTAWAAVDEIFPGRQALSEGEQP